MNKAYWNGHELRGPITMEKPEFNYDFPPDGPSNAMLESAQEDFDYCCRKYYAHLASLPVIPSSGFEGYPVGEVEYEMKEQWLLSYGQGAAWYDADDKENKGYKNYRQDVRFIANPATPKASEQSLEDEILAAADKYGFRVPYDGTHNFYDHDAIKHFLAGVRWMQNKIKQS